VTRDEDKLLARFEAWYEQAMPCLFNYVSFWVCDKAVAEELTAAICERALTRLEQYDRDRGRLDAWVFGIARNMMRDHFRALRRRPAPLSLEDLPHIEAEGVSPERIYETVEAFGRVARHLEVLPESEREVIALRYGAGLSNPEIARVTGRTLNYVGVLLHRALKRLRQAILSGEEV